MDELIELAGDITIELFAFKWFRVLFVITIICLAIFGIYKWTTYDPFEGIETFITEEL